MNTVEAKNEKRVSKSNGFTLVELLAVPAVVPTTPPRRMSGRRQARKGFTLVELLVVIAIIAVLAAMLLPALKNARSGAQSATCKSNLRQMTAAGFLFSADNNGWLTTPARKRSTIKRAWYDVLQEYIGKRSSNPSSVWFCPALYNIRANSTYTYSENNKLSTATFGLSGRLDWSPVNMVMMLARGKTDANRWPVRMSTIPYFMDGTHNHRGWDNNSLIVNYFPHNWTCNMSFLDGHVETTKRWEGVWGKGQPTGGFARPEYIQRISRTRGAHPF